MKYFVLLCNGAADRKIPALGDKTPLEAAEKPTFNMLSYRSFNGLVSNVSGKYPPSLDTAYLSSINFDPDSLTGFAGFDATDAGIELTEEDTVYRCSSFRCQTKARNTAKSRCSAAAARQRKR